MNGHERAEARQRTSPTGAVVYQAIRAEGELELERASRALAWSGLAAGLSMGLSLIATALVHAHTPGARWQPLLTSLGYPLGFIVVVLGRQQLFTENTLTVVLPFLATRRLSVLKEIARLWTVVLVANVAGAAAVAFLLASTDVVDRQAYDSMLAVAEHAYETSFGNTLLRGIIAGWLIALMVWLMPFAETARVFVIALLTYVVGLGGFSHIIAGTVDASFLVFAGVHGWSEFLIRFFLPTLIGNVIGGVLLVAALNHAQVTAGENVSRPRLSGPAGERRSA